MIAFAYIGELVIVGGGIAVLIVFFAVSKAWGGQTTKAAVEKATSILDLQQKQIEALEAARQREGVECRQALADQRAEYRSELAELKGRMLVMTGEFADLVADKVEARLGRNGLLS